MNNKNTSYLTDFNVIYCTIDYINIESNGVSLNETKKYFTFINNEKTFNIRFVLLIIHKFSL